MNLRDALTQRVLRGLVRRQNNLRIANMAQKVAGMAPPPTGQPVAFFKASTGIDDLSWNSAFHLLTSWALRLEGAPVAYFACRAGMSRCVLGTHREDVGKKPPCRSCIHQSETLYGRTRPSGATRMPGAGAISLVRWFEFERDLHLEAAIQPLSLDGLVQLTWPAPERGRLGGGPSGTGLSGSDDSATAGDASFSIPLGELCLPGLRWILRRHNLRDDAETRFLLREYILSAWNIALKFSEFLDHTNPFCVVLFNGQFFPEATAKFVAQQRGLRVITHEVGLLPASAFFTDGEATAYPIDLPSDFEMDGRQNARLDAYLEQRFQGKFLMAGIKFWPHMRGLEHDLLTRAAAFRQLVAVFSNVIFDTSQPHANTVFPDMFVWLEMVLEMIREHPDTLFVIRAHPDESRTRKESLETVEAWIAEQGADKLDNVEFIAPRQYLSSYELIERAKFVVVYNSTIGLEASIMGKPVLCGGRARYTRYPTVFFPSTAESQRQKFRELLAASMIEVPPDFRRNARRFLYYQLFRTSLPFEEFLVPSVRTTQSRLRPFRPERLLRSQAVRTILDGLLRKGDFVLPDPGGRD
jgi:hypothetical protein